MIKTLSKAFLTLFTGTLLASNHPEPGEIGLSAEYLYLMPSLDDTYFVLLSGYDADFPNGTRICNNFDFYPGYRLGAIYSFDCNQELSLFYTNLKAHQTKKVLGNYLWATMGSADVYTSFENFAGFARSDLNLGYSRLDALIDYKMYHCGDTSIYLIYGFEYSQLKLREKYTYQILNYTSKTSDQFSKTWGIGPEFGFEFDYILSNLLTFNFKSTGSLLAGQTKGNHRDNTGGALVVETLDNDSTRIIPAFHASFGISTEFSVKCRKVIIEAGYEFNSYVRGLARSSYPDDEAPGFCATNYYNFDIQGVYISGSVNF